MFNFEKLLAVTGENQDKWIPSFFFMLQIKKKKENWDKTLKKIIYTVRCLNNYFFSVLKN